MSKENLKLIEDEAVVELIELIEQLQFNINDILNLIFLKRPYSHLRVICKRSLHNLKGTLGMLGYDDQMIFIHQVEDFFCSENLDSEHSHKLLLKLLDGLDILAKSLEYNQSFSFKLADLLQCDTKSTSTKQTLDKDSLSEISSILESENRKLEEHKSKRRQNNVIVVGENGDIFDCFSRRDISATLFNNVFDVYKSVRSLGDISLAVINLDKIKENPFLLQGSFNFFSPNTEFLYIVDDYDTFAQYLEEHNDIVLNFNVTSRENASKNVRNFLKTKLNLHIDN